MNPLHMMNRSVAFCLAMMLTVANLLSLVGSATAQGNNLTPGGKVVTVHQGPTDPAELNCTR